MLDATHDPGLHSWVASANDAATEFPVQNLPFGVFARGADVRAGVAIGEEILDLAAAHGLGFFSGGAAQAAEACGETLNGLMALGASPRRALRAQLSDMLRSGTAAGERAMRHRGELLVPQSAVAMRVPVRVANYTDFYASIAHATNVGSMFRPDNPLLPNYKWVPIGYHGRASSIVVSGTPVLRPAGQRQNAQTPDDAPTFAPSERLDYELEVGLFVGPGNDIGTPIPVQDAGEHLFGVCLLNDWSARDIQAWEYQPLGPFLAKNFATTISPWIVTREALAPFRAPAARRPTSDPRPLPYLLDASDQEQGALAVTLEVHLQSRRMREMGLAPVRLSRSDFATMYWTPAQLITHHTSNGCNLLPGDLLGSGTVSGEAADSRGCLLELTWRGSAPLTLPSGEQRGFLDDGDRVILHGYCERQGFRRIGMGACSGEVCAASA